jgi:transposase-like protein
MAERHLAVDHTTGWRWVQRCAPELNRRVRRELKPTGGFWGPPSTSICQNSERQPLFSISSARSWPPSIIRARG